MRDIKFRLWNDEDSRMELVVEMKKTQLGWICTSDFEGEDSEWNCVQPVMQFTGLTDKNGVDIYEGDLLNNGRDGVCEVVFSKRAAKFCVRVLRDHTYGGKEKRTHSLLNAGNVIGSIYQNPELIENNNG